jgi:hypothetical protein
MVSKEEWQGNIGAMLIALMKLPVLDYEYQEHRAKIADLLQSISERALYLEGKLSN